MKQRLIVEQKITAFVNQYRVFDVDSDGNKGDLIAFAQQKRLAFKERVRFYSDEKKTEEVFGFRAEKAVDVHGRYFVEDPNGTAIGVFRKAFKKSLLNSTWDILENDKPVITISESNQALALFRRFVGFIPIIGEVADLITLLFRYHFTFAASDTGQEMGRYRKTKLIRDHYELSMTDEAYESQDWRLWAAMAVALDALQSR